MPILVLSNTYVFSLFYLLLISDKTLLVTISLSISHVVAMVPAIRIRCVSMPYFFFVTGYTVIAGRMSASISCNFCSTVRLSSLR